MEKDEGRTDPKTLQDFVLNGQAVTIPARNVTTACMTIIGLEIVRETRTGRVFQVERDTDSLCPSGSYSGRDPYASRRSRMVAHRGTRKEVRGHVPTISKTRKYRLH